MFSGETSLDALATVARLDGDVESLSNSMDTWRNDIKFEPLRTSRSASASSSIGGMNRLLRSVRMRKLDDNATIDEDDEDDDEESADERTYRTQSDAKLRPSTTVNDVDDDADDDEDMDGKQSDEDSSGHSERVSSARGAANGDDDDDDDDESQSRLLTTSSAVQSFGEFASPKSSEGGRYGSSSVVDWSDTS